MHITLQIMPWLYCQHAPRAIKYIRAPTRPRLEGDNSRTCKMCLCNFRDLRMLYNVGCKKPDPCSCIIWCKQPISLKTAAIKTVLSAYNIHFSVPDHIPCHKLKHYLTLSHVATVLERRDSTNHSKTVSSNVNCIRGASMVQCCNTRVYKNLHEPDQIDHLRAKLTWS